MKKTTKLVVPPGFKKPQTSIHTSDWEILGDDRIRRWPGSWGGKRDLDINIDSWVGISLNAHHTYVRVTEEENCWWCEDKNAWVKIYSDSSASGLSMKADMDTTEECIEMAVTFIKLVLANGKANDTEHKLHFSCQHDSQELEILRLLKEDK